MRNRSCEVRFHTWELRQLCDVNVMCTALFGASGITQSSVLAGLSDVCICVSMVDMSLREGPASDLLEL